ncbi:MAG TPA: hypothetical protein VIJ79_06055 [Acidobacteriaceae bacterium]
MAVADQKTTRQGLALLKSNPLAFLNQYALTAQGFIGGDTYLDRIGFLIDGNKAKAAPEEQFLPMEEAGLIRQVPALVTPMRPAMVGPARVAPIPRFGIGQGASLWFTVRLTGCSILALDWGGAFSMVHLQPFTQNSWNRGASMLMGSSISVSKTMTRYSLQGELSSVVAASHNNQPPHHYILVQSQWRTHFRGVTGVSNGAQWDFYRQEYDGNGAVQQVVQLNWTPWNHWGGYVAQGQ